LKRTKWDEMWKEIKQKPNSNCRRRKPLKMREEVWGEKLWDKLEEWEWGGGWGKSGRN
jgi:hypothetical protein